MSLPSEPPCSTNSLSGPRKRVLEYGSNISEYSDIISKIDYESNKLRQRNMILERHILELLNTENNKVNIQAFLMKLDRAETELKEVKERLSTIDESYARKIKSLEADHENTMCTVKNTYNQTQVRLEKDIEKLNDELRTDKCTVTKLRNELNTVSLDLDNYKRKNQSLLVEISDLKQELSVKRNSDSMIEQQISISEGINKQLESGFKCLSNNLESITNSLGSHVADIGLNQLKCSVDELKTKLYESQNDHAYVALIDRLEQSLKSSIDNVCNTISTSFAKMSIKSSDVSSALTSDSSNESTLVTALKREIEALKASNAKIRNRLNTQPLNEPVLTPDTKNCLQQIMQQVAKIAIASNLIVDNKQKAKN